MKFRRLLSTVLAFSIASAFAAPSDIQKASAQISKNDQQIPKLSFAAGGLLVAFGLFSMVGAVCNSKSDQLVAEPYCPVDPYGFAKIMLRQGYITAGVSLIAAVLNFVSAVAYKKNYKNLAKFMCGVSLFVLLALSIHYISPSGFIPVTSPVGVVIPMILNIVTLVKMYQKKK
jgi:hypothetical protein